MAIKRGRFFLTSSILIIISITAFVVIRPYILQRLKTALQQKFQNLSTGGYTVQYDSIYIDWKKNFIVVEKLVIKKNEYDTTCLNPEFIAADKVRAQGIDLTSLILNKELNVESIRFDNPHIVLRKHTNFFQNPSTHEISDFIIRTNNATLASAHIEYRDNVSCEVIADVFATVKVSSLAIAMIPGEPLGMSMGTIRLDSTQIHLPQFYYTLSSHRFKIDFSNGMADLDTLRIKPHYNKLAFGRKKGHETDRIEGVIPFLKLSGFAIQYKDTIAIKAKKASIQMYVWVFRDKRLPLKNTYKPLPIQLVRDLPFDLTIDTLEVVKSFVEYEEFAEDSNSPGRVHFDDLGAFIYNISNDGNQRNGKTTMYARASVMGQGDLRVKTEFPWNTKQNSLVQGSLREFAIPQINSMMQSSANMKAESGKLESLTFKFAYNDTRSKGELALNYRNLKLISYLDDEKLKKKEDRRGKRKSKTRGGKEKDNLKTLILNAFVIRKNMDKKMPEEKRTGTILFYRDTSRSVFNYWWKSLLSGVRSAFNMDKRIEKENKKKRKK